ETCCCAQLGPCLFLGYRRVIPACGQGDRQNRTPHGALPSTAIVRPLTTSEDLEFAASHHRRDLPSRGSDGHKGSAESAGVLVTDTLSPSACGTGARRTSVLYSA